MKVAERTVDAQRFESQMALQWGRDMKVAESTFTRPPCEYAHSLQWGRDMKVAERCRGRLVRARRSRFNGAAT